ncbi:hypothetical protein KAT80_01280 [Candidatus Pacearchaeota archaeon]|nr:hypothetical protein [Candidatus Pacearchaeota archaeon]
MIKIIRRTGKKANFNPIVKDLQFDKEEQKIKKKFSEIKKIENVLKEIQKNPAKGIIEKEKQIKQKQIELEKIANLWEDLSGTNFEELGREEIINIMNSQGKLIKDLLKHYLTSIKKEKEYIQEIKRI